MEGVVVRWPRDPCETDAALAECCSEESAALVEHGLLNHVARPQQERLWNCQSTLVGKALRQAFEYDRLVLVCIEPDR